MDPQTVCVCAVVCYSGVTEPTCITLCPRPLLSFLLLLLSYLLLDDYIVYEEEKPQGPRILTAFFYLNDVEAGGGTHFNKLGITVMPKRGRALFWPSVKDESPMKKDRRTSHEALVVESGMKYGANAW